MNKTAIAVSLVVSGLLMLAWLAWGIREYRRTGDMMWLWMAALLGGSLLVVLGQLAR